MKKFLSIVLATSLLTPAFAQKMGSSNRNAPTVKQEITAGDTKVSLNYTAITWGDGSTMGNVMNKENGADTRKMVNGAAAKSPMGTFTNSVDLKVGDLNLPAGEYQVFFTINDDLSWNINFAAKDKVQTMKLALMENAGHEHKQLVMSLYAADPKTAAIYLGFGKHGGMLTLTPAGAAKEASTGK